MGISCGMPVRRALASIGTLLLSATAVVVLAPAASASPGDPIGAVDALSATERGYAINGWAVDPDAPDQPVEIHVYVDGVRQLKGTAAEPRQLMTGDLRPDVVAAHPWAGQGTGFHFELGIALGSTVCVYAINQGAGTENTTLGCRTTDATPTPNDPVGVVDDVIEVAPGLVRVRGWAGDADAAGTLSVHIGEADRPNFYNPGGVLVYARTSTGVDRPDVARAYPAFGERAGFDVLFPIGVGDLGETAHRVCVWAVNEGRGANNTTLGCRAVTTNPRQQSRIAGNFDGITFEADEKGHPVPGTTRVTGWAFDQRHADRPVAIRVVFLSPRAGLLPQLREVVGATGERRDDVPARVPGAGSDQGFSIDIGDMTSTGSRFPRSFLAVYAIDSDGGPDSLLGYYP